MLKLTFCKHNNMWLSCFIVYGFLVHVEFATVSCKPSLKHIEYRQSIPRVFNDPEFQNQYYLSQDLMNIRKTWKSGLDGNGVTICINDPGGVDHKNQELTQRFNLIASFNYKTNTSDPSPSGYDEHGTLMAGLAAAEANNAICGVGVAFNATISGILSESIGWDYHEATARSLSYRNDINDIYSNSWGFISFYQNNIAYMHPKVKKAIRDDAEKGRKGKGNIIVFSAGNGGLFNGTCSYDEYISSIYTIGISVMTGRNTMSKQNVKCAGITAVTYGRDGLDGIDNPNFQMPAPGLNNRCSKAAASSSASAAVASGIFALVLQANPNLTWRDVQHLIARSSNSNYESVTWKTNGAGLKVSDGFGFGVLDAKALTDGARNWTNVGPQLNCTVSYAENAKIDGIATLRKKISISNNPLCNGIRHLEHVLLILKMNFTWRKNVEVTLTSPVGTKSIMLRSGRRYDRGKTIENLSLLSLHHWGENASGDWYLEIRNTKPDVTQKGILSSFTVQLFGTHDDPMKLNAHVKPNRTKPDGPNPTVVSTTQQSHGTTRTYTLHHSSKANSISTDMTKGNSLYKATTLKLKKNTSKNLTVVSKNVFASSPAGAKAFNDSQKSWKVIIGVSVTVPVLFFAIVLLVLIKKNQISLDCHSRITNEEPLPLPQTSDTTYC